MTGRAYRIHFSTKTVHTNATHPTRAVDVDELPPTYSLPRDGGAGVSRGEALMMMHGEDRHPRSPWPTARLHGTIEVGAVAVATAPAPPASR
jgi:hypothetical protein